MIKNSPDFNRKLLISSITFDFFMFFQLKKIQSINFYKFILINLKLFRFILNLRPQSFCFSFIQETSSK